MHIAIKLSLITALMASGMTTAAASTSLHAPAGQGDVDPLITWQCHINMWPTIPVFRTVQVHAATQGEAEALAKAQMRHSENLRVCHL